MNATYYKTKLDTLENVWHLPAVEIGLKANYKAMKDLNFSASFNIIGERVALMPDFNIDEISGEIIFVENTKLLKPVFDFNLGANYTLNSRWHFFSTVQNIFASKYYIYYGYPLHGINVRVGVGYSF